MQYAALPFVLGLRMLAFAFQSLSNGCFWVYDKLLGASIWLDDKTESKVWPK